jgi:hypothetical protein
MLTETEIHQIAVRTAAILAEMPAFSITPASAGAREVLTGTEALAFIGKGNLKAPEKAFARWKKAHGLRPCSKGRYSLRAVKAALEREQRKSYEHAR